LAFCPAVFNPNVLALDKADLLEALTKCRDVKLVQLRCRAVEKTDYRHCRLLRARSQRRGKHAPYKTTNEGPTFHQNIA